MSKSKKNTVDPRHIITTYGADTARLFMLSDSPPERDLEWTDSGVDGAWRYINRLWRFVYENLDAIKDISLSEQPASFDDNQLKIRKKTHQTIDAIGKDIEIFHFNKAVARLRELSNELFPLNPNDSKETAWVLREGIEALILLISPFLPHLSEALWEALGHKDLVAQQSWPKADASLLVEDTVTLAIQVNGKLRTTVDVSKDATKDYLEQLALGHESVKAHILDKEIAKIIIVPGKIINVVAK